VFLLMLAVSAVFVAAGLVNPLHAVFVPPALVLVRFLVFQILRR